jgi:hypothetical protein
MFKMLLRPKKHTAPQNPSGYMFLPFTLIKEDNVLTWHGTLAPVASQSGCAKLIWLT